MLSWLQSTDTHPTAGQIHEALAPDFPNLSLGTVYRNLEVLVAEGRVTEVSRSEGATRYDGNPTPHHHFICEACQRIVDVEMSVPRGLAKRMRSEHGLQVQRVSIDFFGLCDACEEHAERRPGD